MWETLCIFAPEIFEFSVLVQGVQNFGLAQAFYFQKSLFLPNIPRQYNANNILQC